VNIVTFNDVVVDKAGAGFTLTASASAFPTATSTGFNVNP